MKLFSKYKGYWFSIWKSLPTNDQSWRYCLIIIIIISIFIKTIDLCTNMHDNTLYCIRALAIYYHNNYIKRF